MLQYCCKIETYHFTERSICETRKKLFSGVLAIFLMYYFYVNTCIYDLSSDVLAHSTIHDWR